MNSNEPICLQCLYMDRRPESGMNAGLLFCQKKRLVLRPKRECSMYVEATAQNLEIFKASIYGTFAEEME
ncbi:MAG: hypothetical protein GX369_04030 [Euryarchaeota archaeon]|nr:hypothetical protein [Euryarchaeota archaeon]